MRALLVLEEVVSAMKPTFVSFARAEWAWIGFGFRTVNFSFMALEASYIAEGFVGARALVADVWTGVLVLVSSMIV
jgi:hypothetical protein